MNLWILTEERPKKEVIVMILQEFVKDKEQGAFCDTLRILPILDNETFKFTYKVIGFCCNLISNIYIKTISGYSSFVDFLIFYQENQPEPDDTPLYMIEETKTDDKESRNTGVYQRCSKFIVANHYYPDIKKIMLYNLKVTQKETPTPTYIFGTRLLLTMGIHILGKDLDANIFKPFESVKELIALKEAMRKPPNGNVPILIIKSNNEIKISGRLLKSDSLSHDPNIGALTAISDCLRKLGWDKDIVITDHGLSQSHLGNRNKFTLIANKLNIKLLGLMIPNADFNPNYWKYDLDGEKLGTIFIHLIVENFTTGYAIFENHAGCEKGYFITADCRYIPIEKYSDKIAYKAGDKTKIIYIPDLILIDLDRTKIINVEGKKFKFKNQGIEELGNYNCIEEYYIKENYPNFQIIRTVVLYGSNKEEIMEIEVGFLLNKNGKLILGIQAPELFHEAIRNLLDFWRT